MKKTLFRKGIIFAITILFIGMNVNPTYGILSFEKPIFEEKQFNDCYIVENPGLSLVTVMVVGEIGRDNWYG